MSSAVLHRAVHWLGAVVIAAVVLDATASCASAALPPLRNHQVHEYATPKWRGSASSRQSGVLESGRASKPASQALTFGIAVLKYGIDDPRLSDALDIIGDRWMSEVEKTAARAGDTPTKRRRSRRCAGAGMKAVGEAYLDDLLQAGEDGAEPPAPDFDHLSSGLKACAQATNPRVPESVLELSTEFANRVAARARKSSDEAGTAAAVARWMIVTGRELDPDVAASPSAPASDTDIAVHDDAGIGGGSDDGSTPWGLLGGGLALVIVGGAIAVARSRRSG